MRVRCTRLRNPTSYPRASEAGQTITEYALIVAVLAMLLVVALLFLALHVSDLFRRSGTGTDPGARPGPFTPPVACDSSYAGACIPPAPPDIDCSDLPDLGVVPPVRVVGDDPHDLDPDGDGLGC
jgi:Flp pilus assembly pilin Flp